MAPAGHGRRLGLRPARHDQRTLKLATYLRSTPAPPPMRDWTGSASPGWGDMLNNQIGDCAIASQAHAVQAWTSLNGGEVTIGDLQVLQTYREVSGYDPARTDTDAGCVMLDAMKHWRSTGVGGHRIEAFVSVDPRNRNQVEAAINLFGGVLFGFNLPAMAQSQTIWDVAPPNQHGDAWKPGSWGGHAVFCPVYSRTSIGVVTWGAIKMATWEWVMTYGDEAYAPLSLEWFTGGRAPNGFDLNQLRADLAALS
jgi:hypothetical protein